MSNPCAIYIWISYVSFLKPYEPDTKCHVDDVDCDLGQVTLGQGHGTPLCPEQPLCNVWISDVCFLKHYTVNMSQNADVTTANDLSYPWIKNLRPLALQPRLLSVSINDITNWLSSRNTWLVNQ